MKVHSAVIKLVMRKNKTLSDGTHPIMLRVSFNGQKEKATHYSCLEKEWDARNMMLKKSVRNSAAINAALKSMLRYYEDIRDALDASGVAYTAAMVLDEKRVADKTSTLLMDLEARYEKENMLSAYTVFNRRSIVKSLETYVGSAVDVVEVDNEMLKGYVVDRLKAGRTEGYIRNCFRIILSLVHFADDAGVRVNKIDGKIGRRLSEARSKGYVHPRSVEFMKKYFLSQVTTVTSKGGWTYNDDALDELLDVHSPLFALALWLLMFRLQGLAPIDVALLRRSDFRNLIVDGVPHWAIDVARSKTKRPVKVRVRCEGVFNLVVIKTFLMFGTGEYYLPLLDGINRNDEKAVRVRLSSRLTTLRPKLKKMLNNVNSMIVQHNVEESDNVPLIDTQKVNYYSARHSYAQAYLSAEGASPVALASLMGRSVNTLATYIAELTEESDITAAADVIA